MAMNWDRMDTTDVRQALSDIKSDIDQALEMTADVEAHSNNIATHTKWVLKLSDLEIKMSNFATHMRKKFSV